MESGNMSLVMIPQKDWTALIAVQQKILQELEELNRKRNTEVPLSYVSAKAYMSAVGIKRTKFDELVKTNKIKTVKKRRKIYVPLSEVDRYFNDPEIQ